jgi:hypothetical protein
MYQELSELKKKDSFVSLYYNHDDREQFLFGKIDAMDDYFVLLRAYDNVGKPAGLCMLQLDDVIRVEYGDPYSERMKKLIGNVTGVPSGVTEPVLDSMLEHCRTSGRVASFELDRSGQEDVIGVIERIDRETVTVKQVDLYGEDDGFTCFRIEVITFITLDSDVLSARTKLRAMHG